MIEVKRRAQRQADRAGDPLDGLVNMFDVGIVLAVAFLIAALQSLHLTEVLTKNDVTIVGKIAAGHSIIVKRAETLLTVKLGDGKAAGAGRRSARCTGSPDGRLVYVKKPCMDRVVTPRRTASGSIERRDRRGTHAADAAGGHRGDADRRTRRCAARVCARTREFAGAHGAGAHQRVVRFPPVAVGLILWCCCRRPRRGAAGRSPACTGSTRARGRARADARSR